MADKTKCSYEMCPCMATEDSDYCSAICENADDTDEVVIKCECGHPGCE